MKYKSRKAKVTMKKQDEWNGGGEGTRRVGWQRERDEASGMLVRKELVEWNGGRKQTRRVGWWRGRNGESGMVAGKVRDEWDDGG